jgi:phosphohistidine phosphatase SixA
MSNRLLLAALALIFALGAPAYLRADEAAAWSALRAGGHVALMRHADAPGGVGDPPGFKLDDCTTQRNLSDRGRADAAAIGARLKTEGIAFEKVLASPWCRCVDTATLMEVGPVETERTFSNVVVLSAQREALTQGARELLAAWKGLGTLLVVTHGANIRALTGISPVSGEIVVANTAADGPIQVVGRIPPPR